MKRLHVLALVLWVVGCGAVPKRSAVVVSGFTSSRAQPLEIVQPTRGTVFWCPGGYTNFVGVSSVDLAVPLLEWPVYVITDKTNFIFESYDTQRFFAIYGTNSDGDFAWGIKGTNCDCQ